jgi:orotate phosphoribosyltransferase
MTSEDARRRLLQILVEKSLCFGSFRLASGGTSDHYVDVRRTSLDPEGLSLIARLLAEGTRLGEPDGPDTAGGPTIGADPIVAALGLEAYRRGRRVDLFLVRGEEKDHGVGGRLAGSLRPGARVLLVDDVLTQGGSLASALAAVEKAGATVAAVGCVVDREAGGAARLAAPGRTVHALFTVSELLAASGRAASR